MSTSMFTIGLMLKAYDGMSGVLGTVNNMAARSAAAFGQIQTRIGEVSKRMEHMGRQAAADGLLMGGAMLTPIKAYAELDAASNNLQVALMNNLGKIPAQFSEINKQAVELGNLLPGTTADFINASTALKENGTGLEAITGGGLKAASYLSVILKQLPRDAAEMTAKFRESFGLTENQLVKMADLTQRAKFAFGLNPDEIKYAAQYSGATLNALHLTGIENAKKMLAFQGFARQRGMDGSVFGTNFAQMLNQIGQLSDKLGRHSKPMREVNKELAQYGINLQFFGKNGEFLGLDNLFTQLAKLRKLGNDDKARLNITNRLFGMEGGRTASIAVDMGPEGLQKNLGLMAQQADLMQRIDLATKSANNTWESFTGTATNLMAAIGKPIVEVLQPWVVKLNELTGGPLMNWVEKHKTLTRVIGLSTLALSAMLLALGATGLVFGAAGRAITGGMTLLGLLGRASSVARDRVVALNLAQRAQIVTQNIVNAVAYRGGIWAALQYALLTTKLRTLECVGATRAWIVAQALSARANLFSLPGLKALALGFGSRFVLGIRAATVAMWAFSAALLANPLTWIVIAVIAAVAAIAFVVWKYWKPISAFFVGLWAGFKAGLAPLMPLFSALSKAFAPLLPPLQAAWAWFKRLFKQVDDTGGAAQSFGVKVGHAMAGCIVWTVNLVKTLFNLPGKFFDLGVNIVQGLARGIRAIASKPVEAIASLGGEVAGAFKRLLGIHSPSRVFMGFGMNIGEGAAIGVEKSTPRFHGAIKGMAATGARFPSLVGPVAGSGRASAAASEGGVQITFAPQITVQGGGGSAADQLKSALSDSYREFEAMMRRWQAEQRRGAF